MHSSACEMHVNAATYASPIWKECKDVREVTRSETKDVGDNTGRGRGARSATVGLPKRTVSGSMTYKPTDDAFVEFQSAWDSAAEVILDCCFLDAPGGAGADGKRGDFVLTKWERKESLDGAVYYDFELQESTSDGHTMSDYTFPS